MIFVGIIVAIIIFSVIILIHEWGHFSAARFFGVKVEEFGLWIPPRAKKLFFDKKWTLFSLNWLPIGWFVRLKWEDPHTLQDIKDPEALINKPFYAQAIIILGGIIMNFLLAAAIFSILFATWVKPIWINDRIQTSWNILLIPTYEQAIEKWILIKNPWIVVSPIAWSIAEKAWLKKWDIIIEVNNQKISSSSDFIDLVKQNSSLELTLKDNIETIALQTDIDGKIWSYIGDNIILNENFEYKYSLIDSIKYWFIETYNQSRLTLSALGSLVRKIARPETPVERTEAIAQVSGPIWIVDFISNSITNGIKFLLIISAVISINLWVFNLLPIPALDGGRFIFISLNSFMKSIFWKKAIPENIEAIIHVWFFVLLIILSILIAYNDILKILQ